MLKAGASNFTLFHVAYFVAIVSRKFYEYVNNLGINAKIIVIRNGKIVWKHGPYCWYFHLNLKHLGWPYRAYIEIAKNGNFCEELSSENDFEAVLTTSCCFGHVAKASEAVQKIATDLQNIPINQ